MSTKTVQVRTGFRTVTPYISLPAAEELIAFVKQVFGAEETHRAGSGPGAIHAEVRIGDCMLMIGGGPAYTGTARPASIRVFVDNPDDVYRRALNAGAVSTLEMTEDHGERYAAVKDAFGNMWIISTHYNVRRNWVPSLAPLPGVRFYRFQTRGGLATLAPPLAEFRPRFQRAGVAARKGWQDLSPGWSAATPGVRRLTTTAPRRGARTKLDSCGSATAATI